MGDDEIEGYDSVLFQMSNCISYMNLDIFESTRHWSYSADDELAEIDFSLLEKQARESLPQGFFDSSCSPMQEAHCSTSNS